MKSVDAQELATSPTCELCDQPIGADRIEALPRATTCFACASLRRRPSRGQTCS
ncbi:TraR/DksA C4-type zinc finger protein [Nocardioides sp.]|uniref:TraR/DksA C4-type zinc finger protein n=1 Tax=Nocardioides sp. TaxID=35761 RepID=UPI0037C57107